MKTTRGGIILLAIFGLVACAPSESQPESKFSLRKNVTTNKVHRLTIQLRKPRLRTTTSATTTTTTTDLPPTTTTTWQELETTTISDEAVTTTSPFTTPTTTLKPTTKAPVDILEGASTEEKHFVSWPHRRRPKTRRFRPKAPPSTTSRPLEKLRKPKPSRPAMYSLDGFVPKPSLKFKPTTEAPADVLAFKMDLQALGSFTRRSKVKFTNDAGDDEPPIRKYKNKKNLSRKASAGRYRIFHRKGLPGVDFPVHDSIPSTSFDCSQKKQGMYADPETRCQVWHLCPGGSSQHRHSFLCPNGTVFSEKKGVCDWWYNVDC